MKTLTSCLCTQERLLSPEFLRWAVHLKEAPGHLHRKVWEWCYICEALEEHGMLQPGKRGLGFAVGQEPLAALFASRGVRILATDLFTQDAASKGWIDTNQHAEGYEAINRRGICDDETLRRLVTFRFADMTRLTPELGSGYDFVWSSCAFEHLGSLENGLQFVVNAMRYLRSGGVAVHTTEFNVSSNDDTIESGDTVLYRQRDIEHLAARLRDEGHAIEVDFRQGETEADNFVDVPPYTHLVHLKLQLAHYVATSIGLVVQKNHRVGSEPGRRNRWLTWSAALPGSGARPGTTAR